MENELYIPRIIDKQIKTYLSAFGGVCIEGPKWCGKTWTSEYHCKSKIDIGDSAGNFQNRRLAEISPNLILEGEVPRMIDEWQECPALWDATRSQIDKRGKKGQFILTGSSTPKRKGIMHSGAGRIARLRMRPMTLFESGNSSGAISLEDLCNNKLKPTLTGEVELKKLAEYIVRGGWPGNIDAPIEQARLLPIEYLNAVIEDDAFRVDEIKRNKDKMMLLLRSLARNESTTVTNKTLKNDIKNIDDNDVDVDTVTSYLELFTRLFLLDNQKPFSAHVRSSVRVKQAEKRHFSDPSLACALLKLTPMHLINDLNTFGFLFEALVERDLKVYAESFGANLYHYQDYSGKEIDAVVELSDGHWSAFEIKLGANQIDKAAQELIALKEAIVRDEGGNPPNVLCVICGMSNAAYQRDDGVYVVPITALKP
ncbi:MAG: ATP-binding protein [Clostridia bacterium]|nr:ATP-binding protein [Clostridia bacterium]